MKELSPASHPSITPPHLLYFSYLLLSLVNRYSGDPVEKQYSEKLMFYWVEFGAIKLLSGLKISCRLGRRMGFEVRLLRVQILILPFTCWVNVFDTNFYFSVIEIWKGFLDPVPMCVCVWGGVQVFPHQSNFWTPVGVLTQSTWW